MTGNELVKLFQKGVVEIDAIQKKTAAVHIGREVKYGLSGMPSMFLLGILGGIALPVNTRGLNPIIGGLMLMGVLALATHVWKKKLFASRERLQFRIYRAPEGTSNADAQ